jgi:hypothetical protein
LGGIGDTLSSLSLIYLLGTGFTLYQLGRSWRSFWDDRLTWQDRQMAGGVAFFILMPIGVLLHEFGHMLAAWSTGSEVLGLHYFLYWGYVEIIPASADPLLDWYIALAGNLASFLLGVACILVALAWRSGKAVVRVLLMVLGVLEIVQTLIFYPLISLDPSFAGDWDTIYSFAAPIASGITLAVHIVSLVAFVIFLRRSKTANWLLSGR